MQHPQNPWARSAGEILKNLETSPEQGLSAAEVRRRHRRFGFNRLREAKTRNAWRILFDQFRSLMAVLLSAATALAFILGEWLEGLAVISVILVNALIGFFTELRAVRSMEALHRLTKVTARVRRAGKIQEIPAADIVPGDIVILEGGDIVPADLRLFRASKAQADESALTGESLPVGKNERTLPEDTPLAERKNMLFKGTALTRGSAEGPVVATGMGTELGRISSLVEEAVEERTPLEKRLDQLGNLLIWVTLAIAGMVAAAGVLAGRDFFLMVETAIALAVAAVPEGLPIVATIALARGMWRMARRNALINRLSAVETLGATNVICVDKTGTLTENRMTVACLVLASGLVTIDAERGEGFLRQGRRIDPVDDVLLREALEVGVLCNNASWQQGPSPETSRALGDPLEVALLAAGARGGVSQEEILQKWPEEREEAFDPDLKMMATFHRENGQYRVAVKGAPEVVLAHCSRVRSPEGDGEMVGGERERWLARTDQMAEESLRVLALATKRVSAIGVNPYENLTFLGLVGFLDPPREGIRKSILDCREAGIRVVMVTGDQPKTALSIGKAVGLVEEGGEAVVILGSELRNPAELSEQEQRRLLRVSIFARVTPRQKLDLITLYQKRNFIVAMTGDGVNDAPAIKKADIGIAMGLRGTQVAREAADMILKDDAFSTIVSAVEQGRVIFRNIRKFVLYLLSCNVSEILTVSLASFFKVPLPILPLQILFLNLVTDIFPSLALGVGEGHPGVMKTPPRAARESILTRGHWLAIAGYGLAITLAVFGTLALALTEFEMEEEEAVTVSFLTLAFAQLWHVFNMRDSGSGIIRNDITANPFVWGALGLCAGLLILAVYLPGLSSILKVVDPGMDGWVLVLGMSLIPLAVGQILNAVSGRGIKNA